MDSKRTFKMKIHGNDYSVDIKNIGDGIASIEVNGTMYEVQFEAERKVSKTPTLTRTPVYTSSTERSKSTAAPEENKGKVVKAPLPGTILEIKRREGDTVKAGDVILIMEAMKMENNIVSPTDGSIVKMNVQQGENVLEAAPLFEIGG